MMRIAIVAEVYLPKTDGVVMRTMNLIHHLREKNDELMVICPQANAPRNSPVPTVEFPSFAFPSYPEYRVGLPDERLVQELRRFSPDVIHYINPFAFGFRCSDLVASAAINIPSVFSFHTLYGEFVKRYGLLKPLSSLLWWLMRSYHNRAQLNLAVSTILQQDLSRRGFERVELWPPAVDTCLFSPARRDCEVRRHLSGGTPERPLLISVSRLAPEKNVEFLADILRRLPQVRLAIIGDGPHRPSLERRFRGLNASFFGYLKGEELAAAYASADAFVYASETETMGNVILEAMAAGLPVVAPRAGGIPSLIEDGHSGLLYEPRNAESAVFAIESLLDDRHKRSAMADAARQHVGEWGWRGSLDAVRQHYQRVIQQHDSHPESARPDRIAPAILNSLIVAFRTASLIQGAGTARLPDPAPASLG